MIPFLYVDWSGIWPDLTHVSVFDVDPGQHPGVLSSKNLSGHTFD